jgi:hypothetical protein
MRRMERFKKGIHDVELQGQSLIRWGTKNYCPPPLFLDIINNATASPCIGIVSLIPIPEAAPFRNSRNGGIGSTQLVKHLSNRFRTRKKTHCTYNDLMFPVKEIHGISKYELSKLHFSPWKQKGKPWIQLRGCKPIFLKECRRRPFPHSPISPFATISLASCGGTVSNDSEFELTRQYNLRDRVPVPKPNIGTAFIPRVELVIEEAQLRLRWEASPFDGSVNGQAIVGGNYRPVVCNVHRNRTIQSPDLQWRTILEVTQMA